MKSNLFILFTAFCLLTSCAKIPVQSVALAEYIISEGKRMHQLNITLTNKLFNDKSENIDDFIRDEYTATYIKEFIDRIPEGTDVAMELPGIINSIVPVINERRDRMQNSLERNRIKVIEKLNQDYREYEIACIELRTLLESVVKIEDERKILLSKAQTLADNKVDFEKLELIIDNFITDTGNLGQEIINFNEKINKLLNP